MNRCPLRFVSFLAPHMLSVYAFVARHVADKLGITTELTVGSSYDEVAEGVDVAFLCGLAYIEFVRAGVGPIEPIAAPLLRGDRYGGRPIYYSDVIVRSDSPFRSFADLRGRSWSFNEPYSHSGYGITRYHLVRLGETNGFFGEVIEAGWHERSIRLVCAGEVDASAIDSQVLAVVLRDRPELAGQLRILDSLGPSTIQPVVAARRLSASLKNELRAVFLEMGRDPSARVHLAHGLVEGFAAVDDSSYEDIRRMRDACAEAGFLTLR
jgi:phosphonate transport system substrate-binding protein